MRRVPMIVALFISFPLLGSSNIAAAGAQAFPDLSGMWGRNSFDFEPTQSGPRPVANSVRLRNGANDPRFRVGDYANPILKPEAADVVRRRGELSRSGDFPDASNQCAPYTPPYSHAMGLQLEILQGKGEVLILYPQDQGVRQIRLNQKHPAQVTPSWYGDSVGRYEGDTLVVDTVGFKVGPLSMVDRYGTPYSKALHLVERFRLIDGEAANQAAERHEKEYGRVGGPPGVVSVDRNYGKGLRIEFTVEDPDVFTTQWSAAVTYRHVKDDWVEYVCAENTHEYYADKDTAISTADKPDF